MDNITCAEIICDLLAKSKELNLNQITMEALCKARYEVMCKYSPIQEYKCQVNIVFAPESGRKAISVDTCLQTEIYNLIHEHHGICIVGCCCGHGIHQPYLQVNDFSVSKMLELGYEQLPLDEYGNGKNCFKPKTIFLQC